MWSSEVWESVKTFCKDNNVTDDDDGDDAHNAHQVALDHDAATDAAAAAQPPHKRKRPTRPPTALDSFLVTSTLGHREMHEMESEVELQNQVNTIM